MTRACGVTIHGLGMTVRTSPSIFPRQGGLCRPELRGNQRGIGVPGRASRGCCGLRCRRACGRRHGCAGLRDPGVCGQPCRPELRHCGRRPAAQPRADEAGSACRQWQEGQRHQDDLPGGQGDHRSVSKICDAGYIVRFTSDMAVVVDKNGKNVCRFVRRGGLYIAKMQLRNPNFGAKASAFVRP